MPGETPEAQPRPEEIIAELWRQIRALRAAGKKPQSVLLSVEDYRAVQAWHAALGELPDPAQDYISKYAIFSLPVFVENGAAPRVQTRK
ncbi:MAG: hypothetical protein LBT33_05075 [Spirochaetia bacterium]|jgi:hypothetical protein|nr:hypothetical protein [Spirochaetia bacterium]